MVYELYLNKTVRGQKMGGWSLRREVRIPALGRDTKSPSRRDMTSRLQLALIQFRIHHISFL